MRTITFGLALALVGGIALAPVAAAGRQNGVIAGSAAAEAKQPNEAVFAYHEAAGPFTLQDGSAQIADLMIKKGANVSCNRPQAAYILLAGAAAAGVATGVAGSTVPPTTAPPVQISQQSVSGAQ